MSGARKLYKNKVHLNDLGSCRRYMARVINMLDEGQISGEEARDRGYCIKIISDLIKSEDLEQRVEELEKLADERSN